MVVEKKRVSAFTGSGLDVVLRGLGVEKLVLCGLSTSGVVLSTVCEASDRYVFSVRNGAVLTRCLTGILGLRY